MSAADFCSRCGFLKTVAHTDVVAREPPFKGTKTFYYCKECFETLGKAEAFIDSAAPSAKVPDADSGTTMRRKFRVMFALGAVTAMGLSFAFFYIRTLLGGCP